jgi:hypothetical protein
MEISGAYSFPSITFYLLLGPRDTDHGWARSQNQPCISMRKVEEAFIHKLEVVCNKKRLQMETNAVREACWMVGMEMGSVGGGLIGFSLQT